VRQAPVHGDSRFASYRSLGFVRRKRHGEELPVVAPSAPRAPTVKDLSHFAKVLFLPPHLKGENVKCELEDARLCTCSLPLIAVATYAVSKCIWCARMSLHSLSSNLACVMLGL